MTQGAPGSSAAAAPREDLARTARERGNLYAFLAALYRQEPTAAFLREIRDAAFLDLLSRAGVHFDAAFLDRSDDELALDLAVEYTRLFIGPGKHVSPHESVQRGEGDGSLWGAETSEVWRFIEASGFAFRPTYRGLPDHVSVELEFMGELARCESEAWAGGDGDAARNCRDLQRRFLAAHLGRWAAAFCRRVADRAEHCFYRELAGLTARFIESEERALGGDAEAPDTAG